METNIEFNFIYSKDAFKCDSDGFVMYDSLIKYIREADGGIIATMRYGNRDKMKKERNKKRFDEMKKRNQKKELKWFLG